MATSTSGEQAHAALSATVGQHEGVSEWFAVDQARIDAFAEVTEDRQFIHVDPEQAAALSPYGTTIAHGFLTLSMISHLMTSVPVAPETLAGFVMGLNYGFEKVRFIAPVKVGARIRASSVLASADLKDPSTVQIVRTVTLEIEGEGKPAAVADWVTRQIYA